MLAHGSSIFGVVPLAIFAVFRGLPSWRWLGLLVLAGALTYVPWIAYQHYADPPGNRLIKWQLGGDTEVDRRGTLETIVDGYEEEGVGGTVDNKLANFGEIIGVGRVVEGDPATRVLVGAGGWGDALEAVEAGEFRSALGAFRAPRFFSLLPLLGVFLIAPFAMFAARARRSRGDPSWRFALLCFAFVGIACLVWGLLLFGTPPARATLHVGSLAVPLLAICGCVAGLCATYPRLALAVVGLNLGIVLILYTPSLTPPPGTGYSPVAAVLAALSLAGIAWVLREAWPARGGSRPG
jgi:hypothetical protein